MQQEIVDTKYKEKINWGHIFIVHLPYKQELLDIKRAPKLDVRSELIGKDLDAGKD